MSSQVILEKLEQLHLLKSFTDILEFKFLTDEAMLQKVEVAKKSLDRALIYLVFDLHEKIHQPTQRNKNLHKIDFANELKNACKNLDDVGDRSFKNSLFELASFGGEYKNNYANCNLSSNNNTLNKLKDKILLIMSERFG